MSAEISALSSQLEAATEAYTREQIALRDTTEELSRVQGDLHETRDALRAQECNVSSVGDANVTLKKELDEKILELEAMRVTVTNLENEMVRLGQTVAAKEALLEETARLQEENEVKLQERLNQIAQLEASAKELEAEKLEMKNKDEQRFASACAQLNELEDDANRIQGDLIAMENERDKLAAIAAELQQALDDALVERGDMEVVHFWSQEKLAASEQQASSLQTELMAMQASHFAAVDRCLELEGHISKLEKEKIPTIENNFLRDLGDAELSLRHLETEMDQTLISFRRESESSEPRKDFISIQNEYNLVDSAGDHHPHHHLGYVRDDETGKAKCPEQESDPISLRSSDQASGIVLRCKELENALHIIRAAYHSTCSDRDCVKAQLTELQEKLDSTETKYSNLQLQSESAHAKLNEEISASALRMKELEQEHQRLQSDYLSLGAEKNSIQEEVCKARDELVTANARLLLEPSELVSTALNEKDETMTSLCREIELEDTLLEVGDEHRTVLKENKAISAERDQLRRQLTELQEKLNAAETNCCELKIQLESAKLTFREDIHSTDLRLKELEHSLQRLQSEYQSLATEKEILQKDLNRAEEELVISRAIVAQQPPDLLSTEHHEQEEAMASMNRVTELEDTVQVLLEELQAMVKESDNFRKALGAQQRERDALEHQLIGQVKNDEVNFSQRQVELENTIMAANIRNESLTDEVNKLRTAFKLVEQANESHQERLALTQIEVTKLEELLDEATVLLAEAMEQKDSLQRSIVSAPGESATNECKSVLSSSDCDAHCQE